MSWIHRLFGRERLERELDKEIADHVERRITDLMAGGLGLPEATRQARLEFGGSDGIKEACRDARGTRWLEDLIHDCRHGLRLLRRSPVFTSVAILSLALGIGANTAIFSLMDSVMFRTMPVREPGRLVEIGPCCLSYPLFQELRQNLTTFDGLLARDPIGVLDIAIAGQTETADFDLVSGSYFSMLGVNAAIGRTFTEDVDRAFGANAVAVISHQYWERRFASDPAVIGKAFRRLNTDFTIIGVTPQEFLGTEVGREPDITVPLTMDAQVRGAAPNRTGGDSWLSDPQYWWLSVMGRLKPNIGIHQALAELDTVQGPATAFFKNIDKWTLQPGGSGFAKTRLRFQEPLAILMGTVALVLLLACANLANLLLAKGAVRRREIAVRLAIGAGRSRVVRQLLAEGLLLALAGGALGVLLAYGFAAGLVTVISNGGPRMLLNVAPDGRVLLFAVTMSTVACILCSLAPALLATRQSVQPALAEIRASRWRFGKGLIVTQMAISVLLLIGAGLFGRTLINMYTLDPGFDRHDVVLFSTNVTGLGYDTKGVQEIEARVVSELSMFPEIQSATLAKHPPLSRGRWLTSFRVDGHTPDDVVHHVDSVASDFFKTFGTPVLLGREFTDKDTAVSPPVAVVNEAFARYYFQDRSPLGRWVAIPQEGDYHYEIVGVVKDVKYESLREDFPRTVYFSAAQVPPGDTHTFAVRTSGGMAAAFPLIKKMLAGVDSSLRAKDVRTLEDHVARSLLEERMLAMLIGFFAGLALLLGAVGIYGVMAYQVARRRREIGIRMALGADAGSVVGMILGQIARLALAGAAIGVVGGLMLTRVTAGILYGVRPNDPLTFAMAIAGLFLVAITAAYLPGRSASRTNPADTLRVD